jgi:hypothetical protein
LIEGNGNVVTAFLTLFNLISFLSKVEKKGKDNILGGKFVGGIFVGRYLYVVHNTKRKDKYFFILSLV